MGWKGARVFEQTLLQAYVWPCLRLECSRFLYPSLPFHVLNGISLSRDARVLPLSSTPFVATNLEDINVDFVFVTRVTAMARGEGVQVACIKFEHRSGSREKGHDAITLG